MEIRINGKPVEYALGGEKTLGEVLDGLAKWAAGRGEVVLGVRADGADLPSPPDAAARARPIQAVARLEVETSDVKVLVVETLGEVRGYADRARRLLPDVAAEVEAEGSSERLDQFLDALPWLERVFGRLEELLRVDFASVRVGGRTVRDVLDALRDLGGEISGTAGRARAEILRGRAVETIGGVADAIPEILRRVEVSTGPTSDGAREIADEIGSVLDDVRRLPRRLEEAAVQIQVGNETAGMSGFAGEIGLIERAFRLAERGRIALGLDPAEFRTGGVDWATRSEGITKLLEELLGAFERGDRVLVGDLLEYELAPAAEALGAALEEIVRRVESRPS